MTRGGRWRLLIPVVLLGTAISLIWWRGPDWHIVRTVFAAVSWRWVVAAVGLNLLSIIVRAASWHTVIKQAVPPPQPRFRLVFSAFCVGLFANVVLPARAGELARVAVLARRMPQREGTWATLIGSVFAHRLFDLFPALTLVIWVLLTANLPHWAVTSIAAVLIIGFGLFTLAVLSARRHHKDPLDELGPVRVLLEHARLGLSVMRKPIPAAIAATFQFLGWLLQLAAVWAAMRAFGIDQPLTVAGLVLVLINVATIFPLWPGNVGLVQAAVALPLVRYGVPYPRGFAFGLGLQAIEASVGVGIGLIFLAREGLSYASLKGMPDASAGSESLEEEAEAALEQRPARARLPG
jgi:glycosyltransferase 2 family protein